MSKFKVGDKVKVVRKDEAGCPWNSRGRQDATLGEIGFIVEATQYATYEVKFEDKPELSPYDDLYWKYNANCLELVQEETMSTLTHKELLQALLDGETLVSSDNYTVYLDSDGSITTIMPRGDIFTHYFRGFTPLKTLKFSRTWTIKPKVILINGIEVPEPCREELPIRTTYYVPNLSLPDLYSKCCWDDVGMDNRRLANGVIHTTEEAAIQHAKALLSFTSKEEI